jgi:hypothetical protein
LIDLDSIWKALLETVDDQAAYTQPASLTMIVPLDIDLESLNATELSVVKDTLLTLATSAGGFNRSDVERIELIQDGKMMGRHRRVNGPITVRLVFKESAVVDVNAAIATMNTEIEQAAVTVKVVVKAESFEANVTEMVTGVVRAESSAPAGEDSAPGVQVNATSLTDDAETDDAETDDFETESPERAVAIAQAEAEAAAAAAAKALAAAHKVVETAINVTVLVQAAVDRIGNITTKEAVQLLNNGALDSLAHSVEVVTFGLNTAAVNNITGMLDGSGITQSVESFAMGIVGKALASDRSITDMLPRISANETFVTIGWTTSAAAVFQLDILFNISCASSTYAATNTDGIMFAELANATGEAVNQLLNTATNAMSMQKAPTVQCSFVDTDLARVQVTVGSVAAVELIQDRLNNTTNPWKFGRDQVQALPDTSVASSVTPVVPIAILGAFATIPVPADLQDLAVVFVYYEHSKETALLFPTSDVTRLQQSTDSNSNDAGSSDSWVQVLASPVVSISLGDTGHISSKYGTSLNNSKNLTLTLEVDDSLTTEGENNASVVGGQWTCVWWDYENRANNALDSSLHSEGSAGWSSEGCSLAGLTTSEDGSAATSVTCTCNHLTHFAVLFTRPNTPPLSPKETTVLEYVDCSDIFCRHAPSTRIQGWL